MSQLPFCKYEGRYRADHPETIGETDQTFDRANYCEWMETRLESAEARIDECEGILKEIGAFAHGHSQGPAIYDDLWEIRRMAYEQ